MMSKERLGRAGTLLASEMISARDFRGSDQKTFVKNV